MKYCIALFAGLSLLVAMTTPVSAAKLRVRRNTNVRGISYSTAKLSRSTNSVIVTFQNLGSVKRITYTLSYAANGVSQGAMGTVQTAGLVSDSRDLYFGTCSHGVCTPHYNIKNATLIVTTYLTNDQTNTKRYRITL